MAAVSQRVWRRAHGGYVEIGPAALRRMLRHVQELPDQPEAGGVLLGRHIVRSQDIVIDRVTEPLPGDRCGRLRFLRAAKPHQREIDLAWRQTRGTCNYLGEWHTHPERYPQPSDYDYDEWKRKLSQDIYDSDYLFFVIVGMRMLRVWEGFRTNSVFVLLGDYDRLGDFGVDYNDSR